MAKTKATLTNNHANDDSNNGLIQDLINSVQFLTPGDNTLPTEDPAEAGSLFITGSEGMNLGDITGSGFAILCVSQG